MAIAGVIPVACFTEERKTIRNRKGEDSREVAAREERQCTEEWQLFLRKLMKKQMD